ncbi:hypothetical protein NCTGTJJY_CDS0038 [Serratia phage 92A1]|nr:hypothetical protein NCTGTJJY_CDS0038 [Serratia phage 92A1]
MTVRKLEDLRKTVAVYDAAIESLLEKRFNATKRIGHIKAILDLPILNKEVEDQKLANIKDPHVCRVFVDIMNESKQQQENIRCYE